jgi:hypothetical protein
MLAGQQPAGPESVPDVANLGRAVLDSGAPEVPAGHEIPAPTTTATRAATNEASTRIMLSSLTERNFVRKYSKCSSGERVGPPLPIPAVTAPLPFRRPSVQLALQRFDRAIALYRSKSCHPARRCGLSHASRARARPSKQSLFGCVSSLVTTGDNCRTAEHGRVFERSMPGKAGLVPRRIASGFLDGGAPGRHARAGSDGPLVDPSGPSRSSVGLRFSASVSRVSFRDPRRVKRRKPPSSRSVGKASAVAFYCPRWRGHVGQFATLSGRDSPSS